VKVPQSQMGGRRKLPRVTGGGRDLDGRGNREGNGGTLSGIGGVRSEALRVSQKNGNRPTLEVRDE
jgi:hypothetical protein